MNDDNTVQQTAIDSGELICCTKGLDCADGIGVDVCMLLQQRCDNFLRRTLGGRKDRASVFSIKVTCLVNDTVATLAAARFIDEDTVVAVIAGETSSIHV